MTINAITEAIIGASNRGALRARLRAALAGGLQRSPIRLWYRVDLIVADTVVVELKTVDHLAPVHDAQLLT
jgi:GxxExxY protein